MNPRIACIQLRAGSSPDDNLASAERFVRQAAASGAEIALLPERWEAFGPSDEIRAAAQPIDGPRLTAVQGWARELGMAIVAGSVAERVAGDERLRNTSVAFDRDGRQVGVYRKIHQFDVDLPGQRVRESDTDAPGTGGVIARVRRPRASGLTICYDLRFPELYRAYAVAGATIADGARRLPRAHRTRPLGSAAACPGNREPVLRGRRQSARRAARGPDRLRALDDRRSRGARCSRRPPTGRA